MGIADKKGKMVEETIKYGDKVISEKKDSAGIEETAEEKIRRMKVKAQEAAARKLVG